MSVVQRTDDGFRDPSCRGLDDVGGVDLDALVVEHARSVIEPSAPDRDADGAAALGGALLWLRRPAGAAG